MERHISSGPMAIYPRPAQDIVVKLKGSESTQRTFQALTAGAPVRTAGLKPFERLLQSDQVESVEPLFPDGSARRASVSERLVLTVGNDVDPELAGLNVMHLKSASAAVSAVADLNTDPDVEYAHVIQERFLQVPRKRRAASSRARDPSLAALGKDPLLNRQWGLRAVELYQAQQAAGFKEAADIVIAVIDTGIDKSHPDLHGVIFDEQNFTPGPVKDIKGHGTHVTGIIAAARNNQIGICGMCQSRKIMSLKALGPYDGPGYYRAIRYATDNGAQILNFSLGGAYDPTEELLIRRALERSQVIVAAMGNNYVRDNAPSYPAAIKGVIAVGASTEVDRRAPFSQTGPHISLLAPGQNILSTVPTYPSELAKSTDYDSWPGTSMATPFVTAAVALMLAKRPGADLKRITQALQTSADKIAGATKFNEEYGHGRLNLRRSLAAI